MLLGGSLPNSNRHESSRSLEVVADPSSPSAQPERKQPARPPSPQHETTELTTKKIHCNVQMAKGDRPCLYAGYSWTNASALTFLASI